MNDIESRLNDIDDKLETTRYILEYILTNLARISKELNVEPASPEFKIRTEREADKPKIE